MKQGEEASKAACALDQARAELHESEARFRAAFDHAAIGMALVDLEGRWLQVNSSLCRILGYSEPQMLTANVRSMVFDEDAASDARSIQQLLAGQIIDYRIVKRFIHQQGRLVWVQVSASLVRDSGGQPAYFIQQIQDITSRKEAEEALRISEEEYRATFELAGVGKVQIDLASGRFARVNRKFCQIIGYTEAELGCTTLAQITHPDDHSTLHGFTQRMHLGELPEFTCERMLIRKDGAVIWVNVNAAALSDLRGNMVRAVATVEDITGTTQATLRRRGRRIDAAGVPGDGGKRDLPLPQVLTQLVQTLERQVDGFAAVMAISDAELVVTSSNPGGRLAKRFAAAMSPLASALSPLAWESPDRCGVSLIPSSDIWTELRPLAVRHGLAACWGIVIKSDDNMPLGLLTMLCTASRGGRRSRSSYRRSTRPRALPRICLEHHNTTRAIGLILVRQRCAITGLPNPHLSFEDRVDQALKLASRENRRLALFVMDIDHFKEVNDTLGHNVGDALLQQFAHRINGLIRASDTLARMGGDEFMLILPEVRDDEGPAVVARKILTSLKTPFQINDREVKVSGSIGIAIYLPGRAQDSPSLQRSRMRGMYQVKQSG